jgi:hypothetical protein
VLIVAGIAAIGGSLTRLHVILHRRRTTLGPRPLPVERAPLPTGRW